MTEAALVLTRKEAAKLAKMSVSTIDRAIARGDLRAKKYGARSILLRTEVERFVTELPDQEPKATSPK